MEKLVSWLMDIGETSVLVNETSALVNGQMEKTVPWLMGNWRN